MPVKMIAAGRYYDRDAAKEYRAGQHFVVADDRTAERLVRSGKARRDVVKPEPAKTEVKTRVMKAETLPEVVTAPEPAPVVSEPETPPAARQMPFPVSLRGNRYRRNDMKSED